MERIFIYILLLCAFACSANDNVFFGKGNKHQISLAAGESIRRGGLEHLYTAFLIYSEPSDFSFYRQEIIWSWEDFTLRVAMIAVNTLAAFPAINITKPYWVSRRMWRWFISLISIPVLVWGLI